MNNWKRINPIPVDVPRVMVVFCGTKGVERKLVPVTELTPRERMLINEKQMLINEFDAATEPEPATRSFLFLY
jgi:hypothetical protein